MRRGLPGSASVATRVALAGLGALVFGLGCAGAERTPAASAGDAPVEGATAPLAPPTPDEERLRGELESEVSALAALGPRSLAHTWNLYTATDHLARKLEVYGYEVVRQGFPVGEEVLQNIEVVLPGAKSGQTVVVAARYDTAAESPGANASASGTAVLLTLAKELVGRRYARSVRLVWLANECNGSNPSGSAVYAKKTRAEQVPVVATLTLGSLGYYSVAANSQRYPEELLYGAEGRPTAGNFLAVLSNAGSHGLLEQVRPALGEASLPVEELILPDTAPLAAEGPQARFWSAGLSGLVLTDTAQFRSPHYDDALDVVENVDFDRLARVASVLRPVLSSLAGPLEPPGTPPAPPSLEPPPAGPALPSPVLPPLPPGIDELNPPAPPPTTPPSAAGGVKPAPSASR